MRGMPSVATLRTWVSPRWNRPEPCAVGSTPTSAESGTQVGGATAVDADALVDDAAAHDGLGAATGTAALTCLLGAVDGGELRRTARRRPRP